MQNRGILCFVLFNSNTVEHCHIVIYLSCGPFYMTTQNNEIQIMVPVNDITTIGMLFERGYIDVNGISDKIFGSIASQRKNNFKEFFEIVEPSKTNIVRMLKCFGQQQTKIGRQSSWDLSYYIERLPTDDRAEVLRGFIEEDYANTIFIPSNIALLRLFPKEQIQPFLVEQLQRAKSTMGTRTAFDLIVKLFRQGLADEIKYPQTHLLTTNDITITF